MGALAVRSPRRRRVALAAFLLCLAVAAPAEAAVSSSLTRYPYLTDSIQTSVTVNWATTSAPGATGTLQWGPVGSCSANTVDATRTGIVVGGLAEDQWRARIPVSPDQRYCYRVLLGGADLLGDDPSPVFTSQVAAGSSAPFSFAVFGDWGQAYAGSANPDQANVLARIAGSGARFAVMTGDTAYPGGGQTEYGDLHQVGTDVSGVFGPAGWGVPGRSIPVFNVTGNHGFTNGDVQLTNWPEGDAAAGSGGRYGMEGYPAVNGSAPKPYPSLWYAFDAGAARFYVLTAAWSEANVGKGDVYTDDVAAHWSLASDEYRWLAADLAAHPGGLKFAFWHYPLYADSPGQGSDTALQGGAGTLQGLLDANHVNVAFNGHAHGYERNLPDSAGLVSYVLGNGGAALGVVGACSPFDAYAIGTGGSSCGLAPAGLPNDRVFGFAKVTVDGSQVTVTPTDEMGRTFDVRTYTFAAGQVDRQAPSVPAGLAATAPAATRVELAWGASTDDVLVTGYRIYRDGALLTTRTGTGTTYADATVAPSTTYSYEVTALDAAGNESPRQATPASVTTPGLPDTHAPSAPGGLTATPVSSSHVDLAWTASTDDVGVAGYRVYRDGALLGATALNATAYSDDAAIPGSSYTYTVSAVDAAGNESPPSSVRVSTLAGVPGGAAPPAGGAPASPAGAVAGETAVHGTLSIDRCRRASRARCPALRMRPGARLAVRGVVDPAAAVEVNLVSPAGHGRCRRATRVLWRVGSCARARRTWPLARVSGSRWSYRSRPLTRGRYTLRVRPRASTRAASYARSPALLVVVR
jgi:chitodextrinase